MKQETVLEETLLGLETELWEALRTGKAPDGTRDADFLGVSAGGLNHGDGQVRSFGDAPTVETYRLEDARLKSFGPDHALLVYRANYTRPGGDIEEVMYVSSVWRRNGSGWANVFSQDTPESRAAPGHGHA